MKKIILLISFLFLSINGYSQFEGFEGFPAPAPPTWTLGSGDWAVFDNGVQSTPPTYWTQNPAIFPPLSGTVAGYMDIKNIGAGNTSEDYLASPIITVPANAQLKFWARSTIAGNDNTVYRVMFAPAGSTQNNPLDYITIAEFDETQLTTGPTGIVNNFDVWTEHIIDLSGFAGTDIYLAFVMVNTQPGASASGDRWLLDDINIVSQCFNPTTSPTTLITDTTATLNWLGTSSAYDVEVLLATATQGTGTFTNGVTATTLPVTGLLANTCYNYYVRSVCSVGNTSGWAGPFNFCTTLAPVACGGNYADPGGANGDYENDADVPTLICPDNATDLVTVTFTSFSLENNWDFLKVYAGSDATAPQIGNYTGNTLPPVIISAAPGGCLYFVFTSDGSGTAPGWVANITCAPAPDCSKPITVTTSGTLSTTTNVSWVQPQNPDGSSASEWQVLALPCTAPAPTATSTGWVTATTNTNFALSNLNPDTCYTIYVRAVCTTSLTSEWSTGVNTTTQPVPPACGGTFTDAAGSGANYANNSDVLTTICPIIPGELVTVTFTEFNTETNWDALYVYNGSTVVLANQIASANGAGNVPGGVPGGFWGTTIPGPFTSSSPDGCLTFRFRSDGFVNNPGWVANVTCAPAPTCAKPTTLSTSSVLSTSLNLTWAQPQNPNGSTATEWKVIALPCGSPIPTASTLGWVTANTNTNFPITGLSSATCYDFYVMAVCSTTDSSTPSIKVSATTLVAPPVCGGNFVDSGGAAADYGNGQDITTVICPTIPGGIVTVTFTSFNTEANWDALYVFNGNSITAPQIASANPAGNVPGGVAGGYWGTTIPGPFTSSSPDGCLTFRFRSDGSGIRAGWVANITCAPPPSCRKPNLLVANPITQTTATVSWTQPQNPDGSTATSWEVIVLPFGSPAPGSGTPGIVVNTNSFPISNLPEGTPYTVYVRAICSATDHSEWSSLSFATLPGNDECANATFAVVNQNLNCVQTTPGTIAGATQSTPVVNCPPGVANDDVWYTFTATADTHIISFPGTANGVLNYAIFQGTCGAMTQVACNSGANLTPGTTYYLRVYSVSATAQLVNFNLCIGTLPCTEAPAFCTGQTVTYANATNVPSLGTIGCLNTTPNPAFFFLQVNNAGPLTYNITQQTTGGTGIDVDYVAWGPFTDLNTACSGVPANPMAGILPAPNTTAGCPGTLHACSYSFQPNEVLCIPNAQLCEVYVVMITNFSNQAGNVTFTQTNAGGGTTSCFPINTFNYALTSYCQDGVDPTPILAPGAVAGVYTAVPSTLVIDPVTGTVDLSASPPGAYVVTSTSATTIGGTCDTIPFITTSRTIIITAPANATIAYSAPAFCKNINTTELVTITGTLGGSFSTVPATGLYIDSNTGNIVPSASLPGTYTVNYNIAATGGCAAYTTSTTVTIYDLPTITGNLSVCINGTIQLTGSATQASSNAWASSNTAVATIDNSGLVTGVSAGTTTITYTNDLGCYNTTLFTVSPDVTMSLSTSNDTQTVCINTAIANIDYATSLDVTSVNVTGLPTGVTGSLVSGVYTISGTPTVSGSFPYSITTVGGCGSVTLTGTITVSPDVTMSLSTSNDTQTVCINTAIANIDYATSLDVTSVNATGLPTGVTGSLVSGVYTISGTPSVSGSFPYSITTVGGCGSVTLTGTITVSPDVTMSLSTSNDTQTVCINTAIANIDYATSLDVTSVNATGLPTGVTGSLVSGVYTISGTPTVSGSFPYSITTVGGCGSVTLTGTINVVTNTTMSLSTSNDTQTVCINTSISDIDYATSLDVTSVNVTGLPTGITGSLVSGVYTISGTPTVSGSFPYSITTVGGCGSVTLTGTITVSPDVTMSLSTSNNTQTVCINTAIANIDYAASLDVTSVNVTGLPTGVTGSLVSGVYTISGTPTVSGSFPYSITTVGGCGSVTLTGTITVSPDVTMSLSTSNDTQTVCINTSISDIDYATSLDVTSVNATGLPTGVTGSLVSGVYTISGTPTVSGSFPYSITTVGGCGSVTLTGTITVSPDVTMSLSTSNNTQTVCINTAIANIDYAASLDVTSVNVTGLPTGVTGSLVSGVYTISGTPTVSGSFPYSITTVGGCGSVTLTGTITVSPDVTMSLSTSNDTQTVCINTAIANIDYAASLDVTSVNATGLPTGVTGSLVSGVYTISGTPTVSGSFPYSITTVGGCGSVTLTGTITVSPDVTMSLSTSNNTQTVCINTAIANIDYATSLDVTSVNVTGLPTGVTGSLVSGVYTISGTPTVSGSFPYSITTVGGCGSVTLTGTITVSPDVTMSLSTSNDTQTVCINTAIANIDYATSLDVTSVNATGLPTGVTGSLVSGVYTISGTPSVSGSFPYSITTVGGCGSVTLTGTITVSPDVTMSLSTSNDTQTVCINTAIANIDYATSLDVTSVNATGLPTGVTGSLVSGVYTISGTPTVSGSFPYSITTVGGCGSVTLTGTINVVTNTTMSLSTSNDTQTVCINTSISDIDYATSLDVTSVNVTGLPTGITGSLVSGVYTISGTPTVSGSFPYSITTVGGCGSVTLTGTITVSPDVTMSLSTSNNTQTVCINTAIANIDYAASLDVTSVNVTGLPTGVTGSLVSGVYTISGTPTVSGSFPYSITTVGGCGSVTLTGTINVVTNTTMSLSTSNDTQTVCINTSISDIDYATSLDVTSVNATGLPTGVTGSLVSGVYTISGTPTVSGSFPYSITTVGGCGSVTLTGTITVSPDVTMSLSTSNNTQTVCINTAIANIDYAASLDVTSVNATGLPTGVTGSLVSGVYTISGTPTVSGSFPYSITTVGGCGSVTLTGTITISANPDFSITGGCQGSVYVLEVNTDNLPNNANFHWFDSSNNTIGGNTASIEITNPGTYECEVTIPNGTSSCSDSKFITANETVCSIQRGISPNNDGDNEFFDLSSFDVKELSIYNRYGTKVYSKTDYSKEWTGKDLNENDLPDGTYYYMFERRNSETKAGWIYINREKK